MNKEGKEKEPARIRPAGQLRMRTLINLDVFVFYVAGRRGLAAFQRTRPHPDKNCTTLT